MSETKLEIQLWPNGILRRKCRRVEDVDDSIRRLLDEMCCLMKVHNGIGLAANQAGLDLAMVIVETEDRLFKLINPCISRQSGHNRIQEGCLSFPGIELLVPRAGKVRVEAVDEWGKPVSVEVEGVPAIVFQHEIDHINGITFIQRVPFWKRWLIIPKLRRIARSV